MRLRVRLDEIVPVKTAARALSELLDRVAGPDCEQVVLTRRGEPRAVLISVARYEELLEAAGELDDATPPDALRGRELAEHAYRILDAQGAPMHYRELLERIEAPGRRVSGKDRHATLLAAIGHDDRVVSAGSRSGRFTVR